MPPGTIRIVNYESRKSQYNSQAISLSRIGTLVADEVILAEMTIGLPKRVNGAKAVPTAIRART